MKARQKNNIRNITNDNYYIKTKKKKIKIR